MACELRETLLSPAKMSSLKSTSDPCLKILSWLWFPQESVQMSWLGIDDPFPFAPNLPLWPLLSPWTLHFWVWTSTWAFSGSPRMPGSFRTMCFCLCLSLSIPLPCILSLANSYSSFKTQLPCVLPCHIFLTFPRRHYFTLCPRHSICPYPCENIVQAVLKNVCVYRSLPLYLPSSTTVPLFIHLSAYSRNMYWAPTTCQVLFWARGIQRCAKSPALSELTFW